MRYKRDTNGENQILTSVELTWINLFYESSPEYVERHSVPTVERVPAVPPVPVNGVEMEMGGGRWEAVLP